MNSLLCFSLGLSEEDIAKGKASFYSLNKEMPSLDVMAITKSMLGSLVREVLDNILSGSGSDAVEGRNDEEIKRSPEPYKYRVIIVLAKEREQVFQVMKSFKAVLPDPQNIIFAVITETALNWTFGEYINHLGKEHESMKNRRPENNPDMKKM